MKGASIPVAGEQLSILKIGRNCWRIEKAKKVSFLIDAADYFEALAAAIEQAKSSIYIAGWDIDSRVRLLTSEGSSERYLELGDLVSSKVARTPNLQVHLLIWDFAMIYAGERQWLPFFASNWKPEKRIHFHFDDEHPIGASHHQKFVVIDNTLAFCGGIDLTGSRWDTSGHEIHDFRRMNPKGIPYGPFHDLQMMVEGEIAGALGELFRQRWFEATGKKIRSSGVEQVASLWPWHKRADLRDAMVAVARTLPAYKVREKVCEVAALYSDAIAAAKKYIYFENQYLTSNIIGSALRKSLAAEEGPEIVIVLPYRSHGWLARSTMDAIRSRVSSGLREADRHHRLRIFHPVLDEDDAPLFVHAKVMIVDNRLATIGSANLSNRSMGFDSECNLAVEAVNNEPVAEALVDLRNRLLAEHLGATPDEIDASMTEHNSIIQTIETLAGSGRKLQHLDCTQSVSLDGAKLVEDATLLDPEKPGKFDSILDQFVHEQDDRSKTRQLFKVGTIALMMLTMAAAWRWTPMSDLINIEKIAAWAGGLRGSLLLPLALVGGYVIGSFVLIPVTIFIGVTAILFPNIWGIIYAMVGCLLSSMANYYVGLKLGKDTARKLSGGKLNRLSKQLAKDGWLAVMLARNLPVAPFAVVNMIAGASHISFKDFLLGTALGMAPGIVAIILFANRLLSAFAEPGWLNTALAVGAALVVAAGIWWIRRRMSHEEEPQED